MLSPQEFLKSRGWYQLWDAYNWVHKSSTNPDWAGVDMETALNMEKAKDMASVSWILKDGKWSVERVD